VARGSASERASRKVDKTFRIGVATVGVNSIRIVIGLSTSVGPFSLVPLGTGGAMGLSNIMVPGR
jgi:hypothetical protein